jgi:hypothetical protein
MADMSERAGRYERSFPGMVGAMIVLVLVVVGFVVFRDAGREEPVTTVEPVEYLQPAQYAQKQVDFPLFVPQRLPDGWIATSVRYRAGDDPSWHLGMLTGDRRYVGVEQERKPGPDMVAEFVDQDATRGDDVTVGGQTWQTWTDSGDDTALVRQTDAVTTVVVGAVPEKTLASFIGSST